jgi:putative addiction module component (TIGR02574 family)
LDCLLRTKGDFMSADTLIAEASKLSPEERLRVAEAIWQSAWDDQADWPLTDEQREELERRYADYEANPGVGSEWKDVRKRIEERVWPKS